MAAEWRSSRREDIDPDVLGEEVSLSANSIECLIAIISFISFPCSDHRTVNSEKRKKKLSLKLSQSIYQEVQFWDLFFHHLRFCPSA